MFFTFSNRLTFYRRVMTPAVIFMISSMLVNAGNYGYNLWLGRVLGPAAFAEAGLIMSLLLVISFLGMTFQLTATRFCNGVTDGRQEKAIYAFLIRLALFTGLGGLVLLTGGSFWLAEFFRLPGAAPFLVLAAALPVYFLMSVHRGNLQAKQDFKRLSMSYQVELWAKILTTFLLLALLPGEPALVTALAILSSLIIERTYFKVSFKVLRPLKLPAGVSRQVMNFGLCILSYELVQILINYGDLLAVKHYFTAAETGRYTAVSMLGRMIYFLTWMLVMVLIPSVLEKKKKGLPFRKDILLVVAGLGVFCGLMTAAGALFPGLLLKVLFGSSFTASAPLLWKYLLATSLFCLANIFVYYFITLDNYRPVVLSGVVALAQLAAYMIFHNSLQDIVTVQLVGMSCLFAIQLFCFVGFRR